MPSSCNLRARVAAYSLRRQGEILLVLLQLTHPGTAPTLTRASSHATRGSTSSRVCRTHLRSTSGYAGWFLTGSPVLLQPSGNADGAPWGDTVLASMGLDISDVRKGETQASLEFDWGRDTPPPSLRRRGGIRTKTRHWPKLPSHPRGLIDGRSTRLVRPLRDVPSRSGRVATETQGGDPSVPLSKRLVLREPTQQVLPGRADPFSHWHGDGSRPLHRPSPAAKPRRRI